MEMDLNIDDLLEKVCWLSPHNRYVAERIFLPREQQKDNKHLLDLEYVQLNVPKVLGLLNKIFTKR